MKPARRWCAARANGPPSYCGSRFATSSSLRVSASSWTIGPIAEPHLRQRFELAQHGRRETLEPVGHDEREAAVAGLVAQKDLEDVPQLGGRAFDGPGPDLLEQLGEQLLARLAARLDPGDREILELAQPLPRQRRLADAGRAAQEQRLDVLAEQLLELQQRVAHRMRREHRPRGIGGERVGFELVLFEEQRPVRLCCYRAAPTIPRSPRGALGAFEKHCCPIFSHTPLSSYVAAGEDRAGFLFLETRTPIIKGAT